MIKKIAFILGFTLLITTGCSNNIMDKANESLQKSQIQATATPSKGAQENKNTSTEKNASTEKNTTADKSNIQTAEIEQLSQPKAGETIAMMKTGMGDIKIKFFNNAAPKAVENFIQLSKKGYYNGVTFHRVIKDFMIQGGDPTATGSGGQSIWGKPFVDELSPTLHNFRGALSMANSGPNTNGSQFFIVQLNKIDNTMVDSMKKAGFKPEIIDEYQKIGGAPWLDNKYTVFGQVFEGMEVVDKIASVKVNEKSKPLEDVKIISVDVTTQK